MNMKSFIPFLLEEFWRFKNGYEPRAEADANRRDQNAP